MRGIRSVLQTFLWVVVAVALGQVVFAEDVWPEFRGPFGNGHVAADGKAVGLPTAWSETENVAWKTEIPPYGWSTPVVLGNDIWLTTATEDGHDFFSVCVAADTGKIRINEKLFHHDNPEPLNNAVNCYASPSAAIEPGRVYVHFGSYGTACLDTETGKTIWKRDDMPCRHYRGPGSSPVLYKDLLILTFDGVDQQYLTALDKKTGKTVWRTDRSTKFTDYDAQGNILREGDARKSYSTPIVVDVKGTAQIISPGTESAFAYEAATGKEIWAVRYSGYTAAPMPVYGDGVAYILSGRGKNSLNAVKVDGTGDVTESHRVWKYEGEGLPTEPSPILIDGLLYLVSNNSQVTCLDGKSGEVVWTERIGGNFVASPIYADGVVYCSSTQGKTTVMKAGRKFEQVAVNALDEGFMASPAVTGKALILRTKTHLYRIEAGATKTN